MPWSQLWSLPVMDGLDPADRGAFQALAALESVSAGATASLARGEAAVVISGQGLKQLGFGTTLRFDRLLDRGQLANLFYEEPASGLVQDETRCSISALRDMEICRISRAELDRLAFSSPRGRQKRHGVGIEELEVQQRRHEALRESADWPFGRMPGALARAQVAAAPYTGQLQLEGFVLDGVPSSSLFMPRSLRRLGSRALLTLERHRGVTNRVGGAGFDYQQARLIIPCRDPDGGEGLWVREAWIESFLGVQISRELYGFPARMGRILRPMTNTDPHGIVARGFLQLIVEPGTLGGTSSPAQVGAWLGTDVHSPWGLYALRKQPRFALGGRWESLLRSELSLSNTRWSERTGATARSPISGWGMLSVVGAFRLEAEYRREPSVQLRSRRRLLDRLLR